MTHTTLDRCDILAGFTETPGSLTRTFLSFPMRQTHEQIAEWMRAAGMTPRMDAIGNIIGHYPGAAPDAPILLIGSHLDTVPNAGKYDGILGVMLGLAVVEALQGKKLPFAIDVIGFSEEEGVRFSTPYFGSRAVAGTFDRRWLNLTDRHLIVFDQAMRNFGLDPARIGDAAYDRRKVIGYIEAHIEQGPILEAMNLPLGIVTAIAGQSKYTISLTGRAGHAGTVPMNRRHDALAAAAQFISSVESIARTQAENEPSPSSLVATVGKMAVEPGATNVIPGRVVLTLDVRDATDTVRRRVAESIFEAGRAHAEKRGVQFKIESEAHQNATPMSEEFRKILAGELQRNGIAPYSLPSGAGHDGAIISHLCPVGMIFLRSPGGISHHPEESVLAADVEAAEKVLGGFVMRLAERR